MYCIDIAFCGARYKLDTISDILTWVGCLCHLMHTKSLAVGSSLIQLAIIPERAVREPNPPGLAFS